METSSRNNSSLDFYNRIELNNTKRTKSLMPKQELRLNVLNEIIETEKKYVKDLKFIVEFYKTPLKQNRILTRSEIEIMFVNLEDIIPINTKFLK